MVKAARNIGGLRRALARLNAETDGFGYIDAWGAWFDSCSKRKAVIAWLASADEKEVEEVVKFVDGLNSQRLISDT